MHQIKDLENAPLEGFDEEEDFLPGEPGFKRNLFKLSGILMKRYLPISCKSIIPSFSVIFCIIFRPLSSSQKIVPVKQLVFAMSGGTRLSFL